MTLNAHEFMRRFLLHVLPHRFVRIRRYGCLPTAIATENSSAAATSWKAPNSPRYHPRSDPAGKSFWSRSPASIRPYARSASRDECLPSRSFTLQRPFGHRPRDGFVWILMPILSPLTHVSYEIRAPVS